MRNFPNERHRNFRRRMLWICLSSLVLVAVTWLWRQTSSAPEQEVKISTVVSLRLGNEKGQISKLHHIPYMNQPGLSFLIGLMPVDVSESGTICLLNGKTAMIFSSDGQLLQQFECLWTREEALREALLSIGNENDIWLVDFPSQSSASRLVKADGSGKALWQIGKAPSGDPFKNLPSLPRPMKYQKRTALGKVYGLYSDKEDNAYLLLGNKEIYVVSNEGKFLRSYDIEKQLGERVRLGFSAFVSSDGTVYCLNTQTQTKEFVVSSLLVDVLTPKTHKKLQFDWNLSDVVSGQDVIIMAAERDNIYFGYVYRLKDGRDLNFSEWNGPMAIGKIDLRKQQVSKVFDVYAHYGKLAEKAIREAKRHRRDNVGSFGAGNFWKVANKDEFYLEFADATHYRIDKISFSPKELQDLDDE